MAAGRRRVLLACFGSLGDLHPYLAVGLALAARGCEAAIATSELYREKIVAAGLGFHPLRPEVSADDPELIARAMDPKRGPEFVLRELMLPAVRDTHADLLAAARGCDLLVGHPLAFAVPLVAEQLGLPWVSTVLSPASFFSVHDPPVLGPLGWMRWLQRLGPAVNRRVIAHGKRLVLPWAAPVARLRSELGLAPGRHPVFEGQHSPDRVLAMFSPVLGRPQPDWPPRVVQTGFAFYDRHDGIAELPPDLERFLAACEQDGEPPLVFTLGSAAVRLPGDFFTESAAAARRLGRRAVLIGAAGNQAGADPEVHGAGYVPFSRIMPRALAIVHQGGIGTTGQALAAGRPMLVVPVSHDQPDNAARLERLGVARTIPRARYTARRAAAALGALLADPHAASRAAAAARQVRGEDGVGAAAAAIAGVLPGD